MNRYCNGDYFTAARQRLYRCFLDSTIMPAAKCVENLCPNCGREIDAEDLGAVPFRAAILAKLPCSDAWVEIPEGGQ